MVSPLVGLVLLGFSLIEVDLGEKQGGTKTKSQSARLGFPSERD